MKRDHDDLELLVQQIRHEAAVAAAAYDEAMGVSRPSLAIVRPPRPLHLSHLLPTFDESWKELCLSCASVLVKTGAHAERILTCKQLPGAFGQRRVCIDARSEGAPCGPEAQLWSEA